MQLTIQPSLTPRIKKNQAAKTQVQSFGWSRQEQEIVKINRELQTKYPGLLKTQKIILKYLVFGGGGIAATGILGLISYFHN